MKKTAVATALLFLLLALVLAVAVRGESSSGDSQIRINASAVDVRGQQGNVLGSRRVIYLLLFTHGGGVPIGHAFLSCVFIGQGGVLGGGVSTCSGTYRMPLGYLTTSGVRHSPDRYTLAVTGGTGLYAGAGGTLVTTKLSSGDLSLHFLLTP